MSTEPSLTDQATTSRGHPTPLPTIGPTAGFPPTTATPIVTVAQRRTSDIAQGDVIALPDEVFVPVPARAGQRRTWVWRGKPSRLLDNAHRWRWVYDVDQLDEDESGLAESLPLGFRLLRVSDPLSRESEFVLTPRCLLVAEQASRRLESCRLGPSTLSGVHVLSGCRRSSPLVAPRPSVTQPFHRPLHRTHVVRMRVG
jgi:hypothetical protein